MRKSTLKIAVLLALAISANRAFAHAQLEKATPAVGSSVSAPTEIRLEFSESVEPKFSKVTLTDPAGGAVPLGAATVKGGEKAVLVVPIGKPLAPGAYRVHWQAVSVDTHHTQGSFDFTVK